MKKAGILLLGLLLGFAFNSFSQTTAPADFYAGKWEVSFTGTPNGDGKLVAALVRKEGKLVGELTDPTGKLGEKIVISKVDEEAGKITLYFTAQGYDVFVALDKVDNDNLKGTLMNMFDAKAIRLKE